MPLVFLPDDEAWYSWGADLALPPGLASAAGTFGGSEDLGPPDRVRLLTPEGLLEVEGRRAQLLPGATALAAVPAAELARLPASFAVWALASKLAMELIAHERVVPGISRRGGQIEARWAVALTASEDTARFEALARSMPPAAHAVPIAGGRAGEVWAPRALLRALLDALADALVRGTRGAPALGSGASGWQERWRTALLGSERGFETRGFAERSLVEDLERWSEPARGADDRLRACFRLELPATDGAPFELRFLLQSPDDPSLIVPASEIWRVRGRSLSKLGRAFRDPQESLLEALGRAARLFAPIGAALEEATPSSVPLEPGAAWSFLGEGAATLSEAGFGVIVPGELTRAGQRRLRMRMRIGKKRKAAGVVGGLGGLSLDELLSVSWEAVIGDERVTVRELEALARHKAPLVRYRGAWVAIDPGELEELQRRLSSGPATIGAREAITGALAGELELGDRAVLVEAAGALAEALERLRAGADRVLPPPATLEATLRPYQARGLSWLATMSSLGLGACLADDMGLGKTIQLLAFLLRRREEAPADPRPALLVAPTSVLGNWEREAARFAPSLPVTPHYGVERARAPAELATRHGALVLTSYGTLRRDVELLTSVDWSVVALDEAQNIKSSASATARAARALRASSRFALTGTPVENRLAELWSILEFANPGLLGPLEQFRRTYAVPIESYGSDVAATRLRRMVGPFILRRLKSDPSIIQDLPPKNEMKVICTLTREQASLYKAVVNEELLRISSSEGIERRGRVLALLMFTKQICNHPAQYLGETGPLPKRSGKLARLTEMLEEALASGDKALVFTQFREMGDKLVLHLRAELGVEVLFLHGGTPKRSRDELVAQFMAGEPRGPRVFVLSLKAGGTGLNLTAASHVFHYDRWWNPAVEDQATDRAYRIGQRREVQVHKLLCAGTVEEKIDRLLEEKRALAGKVVGTGEQWITELEGDQLRELFALSEGVAADEEAEEAGGVGAGGASRSRKTGKTKVAARKERRVRS